MLAVDANAEFDMFAIWLLLRYLLRKRTEVSKPNIVSKVHHHYSQ